MPSDLEHLRSLMQQYGLRHLYAKILATNDNSKNQIYLGRSYAVLQGLPFDLRAPEQPTGRPELYGWPRFYWMDEQGTLTPAPAAKFILYPQYPEVRFSGFLRGATGAPDALRQRADRAYPVRCLLLGVTDDNRIIGYVSSAPESLCDEISEKLGAEARTALTEIEFAVEVDARTDVLRRMQDIYRMGWIPGTRLTTTGPISYNSRNGGGYTLEAMFGIASNGISEPDFRGWELKQYGGTAITLMTPEPTSGLYQELGPEAFVRRFGYPDKNGVPDRLNFGGIYRAGQRHAETQLTLTLEGFDADDRRIVSAGGIALVTDDGEVAARWDFSGLLAHWTRKHASAAYVRSLSEITSEGRRYRFGPVVQLGEGTDFLLFLTAVAAGRVYLDPLTSLKGAASPQPAVHRRNQFRVKPADLPSLYRQFTAIDVSAVAF